MTASARSASFTASCSLLACSTVTPGTEQIVADGKADQVALARAFLDNPSWGWHAADALGMPGGHVPLQYMRGRDPAWLKFKAQI